MWDSTTVNTVLQVFIYNEFVDKNKLFSRQVQLHCNEVWSYVGACHLQEVSVPPNFGGLADKLVILGHTLAVHHSRRMIIPTFVFFFFFFARTATFALGASAHILSLFAWRFLCVYTGSSRVKHLCCSWPFSLAVTIVIYHFKGAN